MSGSVFTFKMPDFDFTISVLFSEMCVFLFLFLRNREVKRIKNSIKAGNSLAFLYQDINELEHSRQVKLPRVSVVMPLKGFGEHNFHNWRSQVSPSCCSQLEFFLLVITVKLFAREVCCFQLNIKY